MIHRSGRAAAAIITMTLAMTCAFLAPCQEKRAVTTQIVHFTDVTKMSGLKFRQSYGDRRLDNIVEGSGTGVCVFDYNNDGFLDVYFPNGKWTAGLSDNDSRDLRGRARCPAVAV